MTGSDRPLLPSARTVTGGPFGSAQGRRGALGNRTLIMLPPSGIVQIAGNRGGASSSRHSLLPLPLLARPTRPRGGTPADIAERSLLGAADRSGVGLARLLPAGVPQTITVEVEPDALIANSGAMAVVTATVVDSDGLPVMGVPLSGSTEPATLGGVAMPDPTDASGQSVGTWTAGETLGSGLLNLTENTITGTASVSLTAGAPFTLTLQASPTSLTVGGSSALTTTVTDQFGNFVADGTSVVFTTTLGSVLTPRTTTSGVATSSISSTLAGTALITATSGTAQDTASVVFNPGAPFTLTLQASPTSLTVGGSSALTTTVTDQFGNFVANGTSVVFTTTLGSVLSPGTTANGIATSSISSTLAGTALITATSGAAQDTASVIFNPGTPFTLTLQANPTSLVVGGSSALTATVTDPFGNFIADGTVVTFATSLGNLLPPPRTTTNGVATSSISSTIAGSAFITATSGAAQDTETVIFTPGPFARLRIEDAPAGSGVEVGAITLTLYDTRTFYAAGYDQYDNLIGAQSVAWGATGVLSGRLAPVSGISTTLTPAPILSGTGFVTASVGGITDTTGLITIQAPVLIVSKSDSPDPITPGQVLQYTIVYTNAGTAATQNAVITETYPAGTTFLLAVPSPMSGTDNVWLIDSLAPAMTGTIQVFVQLTNTFPVNSVLTNTVQFGGPKVVTAIFTETTQVNSAPDVTISKSGSFPSVRVGEPFVYTIQYQNNGDAPVTGIRITETYPSQVTFISANPLPSIGNNVWLTDSLPAGQTKFIFVTVRVNSPLPDQTVLNNQVTIDTNETAPFTTTEVTLVTAPVITLTKSASPSSPAANSVLTYALRYTNSGSTYASNVVVTDAVPLNTTYLSCAPAALCDQSGGVVMWDQEQVDSQVSDLLTLTVRVNNNLDDGTVLTNTARIRAAENVSAFVRITHTVTSAPALSLSKSDGVSSAAAGQVLIYSLAYANSGNAPAYTVTITDSIPSNVTFQSCTPSCTSINGDVYSFMPGTVNAATGGAVTVTVKVSPTLPAGLRAVTNTARIQTLTAGDDPADNLAQDVDAISTVPALDLHVAFDAFTPYPTKLITYTVRYTNTSAMDTTGVVISVTQSPYITSTPPGWTPAGGSVYIRSIGNLVAGASGVVTYLVRLPFPYPDAYPAGLESFVNVFLIHDDGPGGLPVASDVVTTTLGVPDLVIESVTLSPSTVTAGMKFTATVVVRNEGTGRACNPKQSGCGATAVDAFIDPVTPTHSFPSDPISNPPLFGYFSSSPNPGMTTTVIITDLSFTTTQSQILYFKVDAWVCNIVPSPCIPDGARHGIIPESDEYNNVLGPIVVPAYQLFMPSIFRNSQALPSGRGTLTPNGERRSAQDTRHLKSQKNFRPVLQRDFVSF